MRFTTHYHALITNYLTELKHCLNKLDMKTIKMMVTLLMRTYHAHKQVFIIGNGGSAATASHMACDLSKGTLKAVYDEQEQRLRVISLTDNVATLTAFGNDLSYDDIFVQQLRNLVQQGDIVIALSASGSSPNIIKAVQYAKKCRATTIGIVGFKTGGRLAAILDYALIVDSNQYGIHEDISLIVNHLITVSIAQIKHEHDKKKRD